MVIIILGPNHQYFINEDIGSVFNCNTQKRKSLLTNPFLTTSHGTVTYITEKKTAYKSFTYTTYGTVTHYNKITIC